jgi:hypothetical protein
LETSVPSVIDPAFVVTASFQSMHKHMAMARPCRYRGGLVSCGCAATVDEEGPGIVSPWRDDTARKPGGRGSKILANPPMVYEGSLRSWIVGRIARAVAYRVNDDFGLGRLVEDEVWIWRGRDAPNRPVIGHRTRLQVLHSNSVTARIR